LSDAITDATVTQVEHYGLYVDTASGPAIVLVPDVSTTPMPDLTSHFSPGDSVRVRLLRFVPERSMHKATMIDVPQPK
jgi:ribosomal protein S1